MARTVDPNNVEYVSGPVRVVKRDSAYRVLWTESHRQRERRARTLADARRIADDQAVRLHLEASGQIAPSTRFDALVSQATDPARHAWRPEWANRVQAIARDRVIPTLGSYTCGELTSTEVGRMLNRLLDEGYSYYYVSHVRQVVSMAVALGIERKLWTPQASPLTKLKVAKRGTSRSTGRPVRSVIPTAGQVEQLIAELADDNPMYGLMGAVAAFTGVRWGELMALTDTAIDLDRRRLFVTRNCVESDDGTFRLLPPGKATTHDPEREVVLAQRLVEPLAAHIAALPAAWHPGPAVHTKLKGSRLLFTNRNNNPYTRSWWGQLWKRARDRVPGWPDGATWHYLRHYAATSWINAGVEVRTVSKMLGHAQLSTTVDWYVNLDEKALDRAAEIL